LTGREKPQRRKAKNITRNLGGGAGMTSVLGKTISADADKNPSFSPSSDPPHQEQKQSSPKKRQRRSEELVNNKSKKISP
jgi:hypothetical protein